MSVIRTKSAFASGSLSDKEKFFVSIDSSKVLFVFIFRIDIDGFVISITYSRFYNFLCKRIECFCLTRKQRCSYTITIQCCVSQLAW